MWGSFPPRGRALLERREKSEPGPPRLLPKESGLMGRNGKDTSRQPFPARPLQAHSPSPDSPGHGGVHGEGRVGVPEATRRQGVHGLSLPAGARSKETWSAYWLQWEHSGLGRKDEESRAGSRSEDWEEAAGRESELGALVRGCPVGGAAGGAEQNSASGWDEVREAPGFLTVGRASRGGGGSVRQLQETAGNTETVPTGEGAGGFLLPKREASACSPALRGHPKTTSSGRSLAPGPHEFRSLAASFFRLPALCHLPAPRAAGQGHSWRQD